jgi:3-hydroxyisobutyrate dehydrogenase-like beta-hydroxyacid dehydrogenase
MKIGFIGLGKMGLPIAQHILDAGHELTVYNRTASKADPLKEAGATVAKTPAEAATGDAVFSIPFDDGQMEEVMFADDGIFNVMNAGAIHVCMSTLSVAVADKIAKSHEDGGHRYISAPVMGQPAMAEAAKLFVLAAGKPENIEMVQPIFDAFSQRIFILGETPSQANLIKLCMNFMVASAFNSIGESMALARKSGIDPETYVEVFTGTVFTGMVYQGFGSKIAAEDYDDVRADLALGVKDVGQFIEAAQTKVVPSPIASVVHNNFITAMANGFGDKDWSVVAKMMAKNAGIK